MKNNPGTIDFSSNHPSGWDVNQFKANWFSFLQSIMEEASSLIPSRRMRRQIEQTDVFQEVSSDWDKMDEAQRLDAWKRLLESAEEASRQMLPACTQCGECCRKGSPTLHAEDLEILKSGKIPWDRLMILRKGEPAHSPFDETPFVLPEERVKVREKEGTQECVFLDAEKDMCAIYDDRPMQCRAQACWDPMPGRDLAEQPFLLREHLFEGVQLLLDVIAEHENRCGFDKLADAFERLHQSCGERANVEEVIRLLSYEEHFRDFVSEKFKVPAENMELLLGRSFARMTPLFGYRVSIEPDGKRCLVADIA